MQTLRLTSSLSLATVNKTIVRSVAVNSAVTDNVETAQNVKSWKEIPGPRSWPIIGTLLNFLPGGSLYNAKGVELSDEFYKRYGPIVKLEGVLGSPTMICLFDANAVEYAANTAMATFYLLAKNPEKQNKLREEILAKEGKQSYLKACIKESMRLLPVVTGNFRKTTKEYNLLGYKIPKDMMLVMFHESMSKMEEHYPKPKEFIPERWLTEKDDPLHHGHAHPFATAPFGFGVRMCIGRRIAELEMQTFISKVVENFQIDWEGTVTVPT